MTYVRGSVLFTITSGRIAGGESSALACLALMITRARDLWIMYSELSAASAAFDFSDFNI